MRYKTFVYNTHNLLEISGVWAVRFSMLSIWATELCVSKSRRTQLNISQGIVDTEKKIDIYSRESIFR